MQRYAFQSLMFVGALILGLVVLDVLRRRAGIDPVGMLATALAPAPATPAAAAT